MENVEIISVCNGYDGDPVTPKAFGKLIRFEEKIGYPKACNAGIKAATGEFIVLLNDDTQLLPQPKNQWLDMLRAPFEDPKVAITGPWMMYNSEISKGFLCFFCCMIRASIFKEIGMLDEAFGAGYAEDVDLCCRAVKAGYRIVQVPEDKVTYDGRLGIGNFPIYHEGNNTFKNWPGGHELMARNHAILRERYDGISIGNALRINESSHMLAPEEINWLARNAKNKKIIIELGSWFGSSTRAMADNLPPDGKLYAIDTWAGSGAEKNTMGVIANQMDGDKAFATFCNNLWEHIANGKVVPMRMHGRHAAALLKEKDVKADLVFIDAGHLYFEVREDIINFLPLVTKDGIICGHDCPQPAWPGVTEAVNEIFGGNYGCNSGTTIWSTDYKPVPPAQRPPVFDAFTFNNELDLLNQRLKRLDPVVDRFIIVESTTTHSGKSKTPVFNNNLGMFQGFLNKITYVLVEDQPTYGLSEDDAWARERHQRDAIMRGFRDCTDDSIVVISDVDEIPNPEAIKSFDGDMAALEMDLFMFDFKVKSRDPWLHSKILRYGKLKQIGPCQARYAHEFEDIPRIKNGGQHLSYFGGIDTIVEKIHNTAHRNIDTPEFTDPEHIRNCIVKGLDLFNRDIKYEVLS
jgi:beta-1,4-mannosyl-glycoprotein beta-1,4-N-acetylglucosaminyltransferase